MSETARFALWPLPDLRLGVAASDGDGTPGSSGLGETGVGHSDYDRGVNDGRAAERQEQAARWTQALELVETIRRSLEEVERRFTAENQAIVNTLAIAVARQVIQREVECDPEIVVRLVRRALEEVSAERPVLVRLNPADLTLCVERAEIGETSWPAQIEWSPDPSIDRGGCIVEAHDRIVDGRLDAVLSELLHRLCHE